MGSDVTHRHQRVNPRWCRREHATTGADQKPGHRPVTLSRRAARCWPSAGLRGGQLAVSSQVHWNMGGRLPLRVYRGPGQSVAHQSFCPGSSWRQGSHLPYTCRRRTRCNRGCGACVFRRCCSLEAAVQRRPSKYSAVTGALVAGRAVT